MLHCPECGRQYQPELSACPEDGAALRADATVAIDVSVDPFIGRTLDAKYRLESRLGEGGMGTVYRATHLLIERAVAIKILNPRYVEDEAARERFRREARAAGRLQHANAVAVTDFGNTSDGVVYIVMELLEGRNFRDVLTQEAPLAPARAVALMLQIASAVEAAHEAGVIHRDLKPGNIFLVEGRNAPPLVKVLDFGIAKLAAEVSDEQETHALTQTGVMIGTPRYMSPEQCEGARLTTSADVYSLGVIFYEMLTGVTPFSGTTPLSVAMQHQSKAPPPPREWVPGLPRELELLTLHTLEKKPEARPSDAGEFRRELTAAAEAIGLTPHGALSGALSTGGWPLVSGVRVETSLSAKNDNVFSVEPLPEEPLVAPRVPALRETTQLLDSFAKLVPSSDNGAQATDDPAVEVAKSWPGAAMTVVAVGETISEAAGRGGITRLRVNIDDKPSLLASHLLRPPVLVAASLVALMCLIGAATFSTKRPRAETVPAMQGSSAEAQPAPPTAETTPTPPAPEVSPTPAAAAAKETKKESANRQRGQRAARGNQQPPKKKDNIFVRGAKKIFRNPF